MLAYKCDSCKKPIAENKQDSTLAVGLGFARNHPCEKCAVPIVRILKKYKLTA